MKKFVLLCMLVIAGMTEPLFAQNSGWTYYLGRPKTEQLFDIANSNWLRHRFVIGLKNGNSVTIRLTNKTEFERLLNMDSVVLAVAKTLLLFKDSLQNEITNKRVDYLNEAGGLKKIRIIEFRPLGNSFVVGPEGPAFLKVEQDTLNILGYESMARAERVDVQGVYVRLPYKITFLINDINKLESIVDGTLNNAMQEINRQWDGLKKWNPENNWKSNLNAFYSTADPKFNRPIREPYLRGKKILEPYVQIGLQNVNNILTTSAGVGLQLINRLNIDGSIRYQLFWEPYFFFDKQPDEKFKMRRNDFITFQFINSQTTYFINGKEKVEWSQNFSLGYLIHRSGNYFRENTFKLGLPGARFKFICLHPEFIFNKLLKNFQPGLKLFLDLD